MQLIFIYILYTLQNKWKTTIIGLYLKNDQFYLIIVNNEEKSVTALDQFVR